MSNDIALLQKWEGHIVPRDFSTRYIVLSYFVSYVGAWTTLELINRRTAGRGLYNWSLLFGSSISMGGVAIWCMHYISNCAIVLGNGQAVIQIAYSPAFTAISFFVPVLVLLAAFTALGSDERVSLVRLTIAGTLAGLAICGMHYLGQASISNYTCVYTVGNVVGSAVIAVVASNVALSVFFVLRATWTNSWWKRALCAIILAGAVFGMHWVASLGTQYRLKPANTSLFHNSRDSTVIVVIVLSIAACATLIVFTVLAQRRRARSANRAQQVVLASAIFDMHGRLMVTPEGLLPNQQVTTSNVERSLDGVFGTSHPVFHWIFRATRDWSSISGLLPNMRSHLNQTSTPPWPRAWLNAKVNRGSGEKDKPLDDYSMVFRELFCVAAADLAKQLNEPLENIGILVDEIFSTGQTAASKPEARRGMAKGFNNLEGGGTVPPTPSRGQLLFLVRRADRKEAERLSASGYRFAETQNVARIIAHSMQVNSNDFPDRLSHMCEYANETDILRPGVYLACFAMQASVRDSFYVLVRKDARNQLPTRQLPIDRLDDWKVEYLSQLDGWSVTACLESLKASSVSSAVLKKDQIFATQLHDTLEELRAEIDDPFFADALLIARPVLAPCLRVGENAELSQATLIAFRIIVPIEFRPQGQKFEFTPLSFFKIQQYLYRNSSNQAFFARKIHREFGPILNQKGGSIQDLRKPPRNGTLLGSCFNSKSVLDAKGQLNVWTPAPRLNTDGISEIQLAETQAFGGIMVSREVSVNIQDRGDECQGEGSDDGKCGLEMVEMQYGQMGTRGQAMAEVEDPETYVDRLFAVCMV